MRAHAFALLALLLVAVGAQGSSKEFDYFLLVREWAGSYCHSASSCPLVHAHGYHFNIHGLWPNYADGSYPQFCDDSYGFNEDSIRDLLPEMRDEWPSFMESNDEFWEHEWSKHGTCALSAFSSEHKYFKAVLDLHKQYDLAAALSAQNIVPSSSTRYAVSDIQAAVSGMYGVSPLVHCDSKGELSEVWMCVDRSLTPIECPNQRDAGKCSDVTIPPMKGGDADDAGSKLTKQDKTTQTESSEQDEEEAEEREAQEEERKEQEEEDAREEDEAEEEAEEEEEEEEHGPKSAATQTSEEEQEEEDEEEGHDEDHDEEEEDDDDEEDDDKDDEEDDDKDDDDDKEDKDDDDEDEDEDDEDDDDDDDDDDDEDEHAGKHKHMHGMHSGAAASSFESLCAAAIVLACGLAAAVVAVSLWRRRRGAARVLDPEAKPLLAV